MSVYFIRAGNLGPVKIGHSKDVKRRLASLQSSHHEDLILIRVINAGFATESEAHQVFAGFRLKREWFSYDDSMLTWKPNKPNMIAAIRRKNRLTQAQLAEKIGVDQSMIARFEAGRVPSRPVLKLLEMLNG